MLSCLKFVLTCYLKMIFLFSSATTPCAFTMTPVQVTEDKFQSNTFKDKNNAPTGSIFPNGEKVVLVKVPKGTSVFTPEKTDKVCSCIFFYF